MEIFEPTDCIDVKFCPLLYFGPPGAGKTSVAQTAQKPLTLDFDMGIHRAANRQQALRFNSWGEMLLAAGQHGQFLNPKTKAPIDYETLILDTGGRALEAIALEVIAQSPTKQPWHFRGSLSQPGWGELGKRFASWLMQARSWGKDVVVICHEDEKKKKSSDEYVLACDLPGKMAWKALHQNFDMIGHIEWEEKNRFLDFSPNENAPCCKNAAQLPKLPIPNLHEGDGKHFLAWILSEAKKKIGQTAASSAMRAQQAQEWDLLLAPLQGAARAVVLEQLNTALVPRLAATTDQLQKQAAWRLMLGIAGNHELRFDKEKRLFVAGGGS
jgi:hypothetical protein